ncbi:MAG: universal stress protein [Caldilineaceae bacterium]
MHRIVVPLDGSPRAEHVLPNATALACRKWHGAELHLVHAVARPTMIQRMPLTAEENALAEQLFERNQAQAQKYLEQLRSQLQPAPQIHVITGENIPAVLQICAATRGRFDLPPVLTAIPPNSSGPMAVL